MSSNYDMEPIPPSPPWWPGLLGLLVIASVWIAYLLFKY